MLTWRAHPSPSPLDSWVGAVLLQTHGGRGGLKPLRAPPLPHQTIDTWPESGQRQQTNPEPGLGQRLPERTVFLPQEGTMRGCQEPMRTFCFMAGVDRGLPCGTWGCSRDAENRGEKGEMGALVTFSGPLNLLVTPASDFAL